MGKSEIDKTSQTKPNSGSKSSYGGCGCLLAIIPIVLHHYGYLKLANFIHYLLSSLWKSVLVLLILGFILIQLTYLQKENSKLKGNIKEIWDQICAFPILNYILKIAPLIVTPFDLIKGKIRSKSLLLGSIFYVIGIMALAVPLSKELNLPPGEKSAAYLIYYVQSKQWQNNPIDDNPIHNILPYIMDKYIYKDNFISQQSTNQQLALYILESRMDENPELEMYSEFIVDGMSGLQLVLESKLNIRTADDVKKLLSKKDTPSELKIAYYEAASEIEGNKFWDRIIEYAIDIILIVILGCIFSLMKRGKKNYKHSISCSAYMYASMSLFHIICFIPLALVNPLFIANSITLILDFLFLETWLIFTMPDILKISRLKSFVIGNVVFIGVQIVGIMIANFSLGLF
ncbi:hypothetical protein ACLI09_09525 [Flavobacterium sp. RHBU_24]|uniref:hypothetical protein n=1 Tax=Flavobacterium sp. RHBU_24 TaxID=3391185 RepID=UPI0039849EB9